MLCVARFVDAYFSVDRHGQSKHAMNIFARLVRCLLGEDAISQRKLEYGNPLVILGVSVTVSTAGLKLHPDAANGQKWSDAIKVALDTGMCAWSSSKFILFVTALRMCRCASSGRGLQTCRSSHLGKSELFQACWKSSPLSHLQAGLSFSVQSGLIEYIFAVALKAAAVSHKQDW